MYGELADTTRSFAASPPMQLFSLPTFDPSTVLLSGNGAKATLLRWRSVVVPSAFFAVLVNVVTQGLCIRGVNRLTAVSLSPTLFL